LDIAWLGLERQAEGHWYFDLQPLLTRFDGKFYGGTGIAVTTAVMEAETGRDALWATAQFVGSADLGERFDVHVEVLASGRRTSQLRMTGTVGGRLVLTALGATGDARVGPLNAQFGAMPDVAPPDETPEWRPHAGVTIPHQVESWINAAELREMSGTGERRTMWARMRGMRHTRATLGFLADMVPSAVVSAAGRMGAGTSLDNAMRFGPRPDTDWMLIDFDPYLAAGGYAHGGARLWSQDGTLLGVASQTATLLLFD
jgi:acyl-CoA thioesterase